MKSEELTKEDLKQFGLQLFQPRHGYRYSLDALLLSRFCAELKQGGTVADLGAGGGIISLLLASINPTTNVVAVENNPAMAALADRNIQLNGLAERVSVHTDDVINLRKSHLHSIFDLVVSNPPYRTAGSGKVSPRTGRDSARHETTAGLSDFIAAAKYLVKPGGRICFIQHPSRLTDFISYAGEMKLALHRLRMIHDSVSTPATMFLAELAKGSGSSPTILPPLIIRDESGGYSREAEEILGEK